MRGEFRGGDFGAPGGVFAAVEAPEVKDDDGEEDYDAETDGSADQEGEVGGAEGSLVEVGVVGVAG